MVSDNVHRHDWTVELLHILLSTVVSNTFLCDPKALYCDITAIATPCVYIPLCAQQWDKPRFVRQREPRVSLGWQLSYLKRSYFSSLQQSALLCKICKKVVPVKQQNLFHRSRQSSTLLSTMRVWRKRRSTVQRSRVTPRFLSCIWPFSWSSYCSPKPLQERFHNKGVGSFLQRTEQKAARVQRRAFLKTLL